MFWTDWAFLKTNSAVWTSLFQNGFYTIFTKGTFEASFELNGNDLLQFSHVGLISNIFICVRD
ncbi:hypothetical protein A8C32_14920 [Flavivirga aquatica]|uniref:Uncharacterized protein n=1 Tax=Flavivirga aquatica TaxID=1849968 RepID=A0A1E5T8T4_9FLAO|nr:hypothetical protein A8C32_14920 [Flavivirga aquatica]